MTCRVWYLKGPCKIENARRKHTKKSYVASFLYIMPHILIACACTWFIKLLPYFVYRLEWGSCSIFLFIFSTPCVGPCLIYNTAIQTLHKIHKLFMSSWVFHSDSLIIFIASYAKNIIIPFPQMRELRGKEHGQYWATKQISGRPRAPGSQFDFICSKRWGLDMFTSSSTYTGVYESYSRSQGKNTAMGVFN